MGSIRAIGISLSSYVKQQTNEAYNRLLSLFVNTRGRCCNRIIFPIY